MMFNDSEFTSSHAIALSTKCPLFYQDNFFIDDQCEDNIFYIYQKHCLPCWIYKNVGKIYLRVHSDKKEFSFFKFSFNCLKKCFFKIVFFRALKNTLKTYGIWYLLLIGLVLPIFYGTTVKC